MITRRDLSIAVLSFSLACAAWSLAEQSKEILGPAVFEWDKIEVKKTDVGEYRQFVRQATATLHELELHVTTLMPGHDSHPPHRHINEELVIIREGTVEVLSDGEWKRAGPGSVVFNASNSLHALKNVGDTPAVYHVINWTSDATKALEAQAAATEGK